MKTLAKILVVEDGQSERDALVRVLRMEHFDTMSARDPDQAMEFVNQPIQLVISDLQMGKRSGIDLMRDWQRSGKDTPFIIMTAYGDVDSAVAAMKLGAVDFLTKPVDPGNLIAIVRECLRLRSARQSETSAAGAAEGFFSRVIGQSQAMRQVCEQTRRAAQTESTVLVLGESGTGKELIAEAIHHNSPRRSQPFILVNMAGIPETLVESELFGHVKGAFTGAGANRVGRFEAAHGGSIFIDEIGDFPLGLQAKLLRVLENRTVTPVGSNYDRPVDARVVAATSRDISGMTARREFREDLFYRLNVVTIQLPPLRDRREDIPLLADHFVRQLCRLSGKRPAVIEPALMQALTRFDWPGNIRQLRNCLESMVVMTSGSLLTLADLPRTLSSEPAAGPGGPSASGQDAGAVLETMKRTAMMRALAQFHGNRTRAAEHLGISVRTLQRKLKEWDLSGTEESGTTVAD